MNSFYAVDHPVQSFTVLLYFSDAYQTRSRRLHPSYEFDVLLSYLLLQQRPTCVIWTRFAREGKGGNFVAMQMKFNQRRNNFIPLQRLGCRGLSAFRSLNPMSSFFNLDYRVRHPVPRSISTEILDPLPFGVSRPFHNRPELLCSSRRLVFVEHLDLSKNRYRFVFA